MASLQIVKYENSGQKGWIVCEQQKRKSNIFLMIWSLHLRVLDIQLLLNKIVERNFLYREDVPWSLIKGLILLGDAEMMSTLKHDSAWQRKHINLWVISVIYRCYTLPFIWIRILVTISKNEKPIIGIHIPAQPQALKASELMKIKVPPSTIEKLKSQAFVLRNQTFCV